MKFCKYNIADTSEKLKAVDQYLEKKQPTVVAYDTETNGLRYWEDVVIGFSFSLDRQSGFYVPLLTWEPILESKKQRSIDKIKRDVYLDGQFKCVWTGKYYSENVTAKEYSPPEEVKNYLKKWFHKSDIQLIMHNGPFDVLITETNFGVDLTDQLFCDTALLKHVLDENTSISLKEIGSLWQAELGFAAAEEAKAEAKELGESVIKNGGKFTARTRHVWRGDFEPVAKYAIKDTMLTLGVFEVGMEKFVNDYDEKHLDWFYEGEVMPLCREVMIPIKRLGTYIDVPHFEKLYEEVVEKLNELEDEIIDTINPLLKDFNVGKSIDEVVSAGKLIREFMRLENLAVPTTVNKKTGEVKETLAKGAIKKEYEKNPHWVWGYILGLDEIPYSEEKLASIKKALYVKETGKRYQFNISSDMHLRWLFCNKLGYDEKKLPQTDGATKDNPIASMAAEVLKDHFLKNHAFIKPLLLWKKLEKLRSTYIFPALNLHSNGVLYMDLMQAGTVSGRFACRGGFNLQTLPAVEELDKCFKCDSKDIEVVHPIELLAVMGCNKCGHIEEDILCPSAIKKGFIAPPGARIANSDFSSLEPRIFAFMSGDPKLKQVYWDDLDLYSKVYCDMMDKEGKYSSDPKAPNYLKKAFKAARDQFKRVVLLIPYGGKDYQVAATMDLKKKKVVRDRETGELKRIVVVDVESGKYYRDLYLKTYPELRTYMENCENKAMTEGFVETLVGRRRHFKFTVPVTELLYEAGISPDEFVDMKKSQLSKQNIDRVLNKAALEKLGEKCGFGLFDQKKKVARGWDFVKAMYSQELNNAKNAPIQGLAAHIANKSMLHITRELKRRGLKAQLFLQIHDELCGYTWEKDNTEVMEVWKEGMEQNEYAKLLDIPMIADPVICDTLREAK